MRALPTPDVRLSSPERAARHARAQLQAWSDPDSLLRFWVVVATALLAPMLHPVLRSVVGVPSHLLWFAHVLPVSMVTYRYGGRQGIGLAFGSLALVGAGERLFGGGYGTAADPATILSLIVAVGFTQLLVGRFAIRVRDEQQRRLAAEAEAHESRRLESIGRLAGGIGHDVNNVLNVILGSAGAVQLGLAADDPLQDELHAIEDAVRSASRLARQLLAFGRLAVDSTPVCVNVSVALGQMEQMVQRAAGPSVGLRWTLEPNAWCVKIDTSHFEQIALNLVVNARDAMPNGGTIEVSTTNTALPSGVAEAGVAAGRYVVLTVRDTGTGMDAQTRQHIFEPFFTTKAEGKGTGLGLATVFGIVRQAKGGIAVESRLGEGTQFRVFLPVHEHPEMSAPKPS